MGQEELPEAGSFLRLHTTSTDRADVRRPEVLRSALQLFQPSGDPHKAWQHLLQEADVAGCLLPCRSRERHDLHACSTTGCG